MQTSGRRDCFVAEKHEAKIYVQVTYKMGGQSTIDREFVPLPEIRDNHPKYVVSMDELWRDNIEGIKHISVYITGVARVLELKRNGD